MNFIQTSEMDMIAVSFSLNFFAQRYFVVICEADHFDTCVLFRFCSRFPCASIPAPPRIASLAAARSAQTLSGSSRTLWSSSCGRAAAAAAAAAAADGPRTTAEGR